MRWYRMWNRAVTCLLTLHGAIAIVDPTDHEKRLVWKYPDCSHLKEQAHLRVDWLAVKEGFHEHAYPMNMHIVQDVISNLTGVPGAYDQEAATCVLGVPSVFFYLTKYTYDTADQDEDGRMDEATLQKIALQYSVLENYISAFHPGIINAANWSFTDADVMRLRKAILQSYQLSNVPATHGFTASTGVTAGADSGRQLACATEKDARPLKIYVYDEAEVPGLWKVLQSQLYCSRGQWGTDVLFHDFFVTSQYLTRDPAEADFFFVPGYAICVLEGNIYTLDELDAIYKEIVPALPYFNVSGGRDHVFVFGSGMAHSVFQSWKDYIPESIVLTPETELFNDFAWVAEPPFSTWRDIVIPGSLDLTETIGLVNNDKPLSDRKYLASFFGRADVDRGPHPWVGGVDVRKEILKLKELPGGEDLQFGDGATHDIMHAAYGNARFCFVPRGKSGWSLRLFEVLFAGCVPVVISDKWELPFEEFLDVTKFVIKWPSTQIGPDLLEFLRSMPDVVVQRYMDEIRRVRCWYFYPPKKLDIRGKLQRQHGLCPEENGQDALTGVMRQLQAKRRCSKSSTKSFYFRDAQGRLQRVNEELQPLAAR